MIKTLLIIAALFVAYHCVTLKVIVNLGGN